MGLFGNYGPRFLHPLAGFISLSYDLQAIALELEQKRLEREADEAEHWIREWQVAEWISNTVYKQAIERHCERISRKPYAQPETRR